MARILVVYASSEGQTGKIANAIASRLQQAGHDTDVRRVSEAPESLAPGHYGGYLLGASIHGGKHQRKMVQWARRNAAALAPERTVFFSVCMSSASDNPDERLAARAYLDQFLEQTGIKAAAVRDFAGAVRYPAYGWFTRQIMRWISHREGGGTDTRRDYEYTDWDQVERFADSFIEILDRHPASTH